MNLKNIYFSWLIYWGKMKGLLNGIAEAIILLASLASFFVLIYQFGFVQTPDSVHILRRIIQQDIFQGCHSALFALFVFPYETSLRICLIIAA